MQQAAQQAPAQQAQQAPAQQAQQASAQAAPWFKRGNMRMESIAECQTNLMEGEPAFDCYCGTGPVNIALMEEDLNRITHKPDCCKN